MAEKPDVVFAVQRKPSDSTLYVTRNGEDIGTILCWGKGDWRPELPPIPEGHVVTRKTPEEAIAWLLAQAAKQEARNGR